MKTNQKTCQARNPVARYAHVCNVAKSIPAKRGKGSIYRRVKFMKELD